MLSLRVSSKGGACEGRLKEKTEPCVTVCLDVPLRSKDVILWSMARRSPLPVLR